MKFIILGCIILSILVSFLIINIDDQSISSDIDNSPNIYSYEKHVAGH